MKTPLPVKATPLLMALAVTGCGFGDEPPDPLIPAPTVQAEIRFDHGELSCPGADEFMVIEPAAPGEPPEPLYAWCSWACAMYAPRYPEPGAVVLMLEVTGAVDVGYFEDCR